MRSNEFFINMKPKDIPPYNRNKHFYEQSLSTIQFFEEELYKIKNGITVGGVFIHPWLYFHCNFFKTPIPVVEAGTNRIVDKLMVPPMRDNEWYFAEMYKKAQEQNKGIFLFGSRRWAKTSIEVSVTQWVNLLTPNSTTEIMAGSEYDLKVVARMMQFSMTEIHPAFALPLSRRFWDKHVQVGYKDIQANITDVWSDIFIKNLGGGRNEESSEKGAGGAPAAVIIEEAGKMSFLETYQSLLPAISTPYGLKCIVLISGTGGNSKLSTDAKKMLSNPEAYKMLPMDWDILESKIKDKNDITWKRKTFGIFMPPQMAYEEGIIKIDSNLSSYLQIENAALKKIQIKETDWKLANGIYRENRIKLLNDKESLNKEIMYHPLDSEECFLGGVGNPFPANEARSHQIKILETGDIGKNVELFAGEDGVKYRLSDKQVARFPFEGGIHNAPIVLYGDLPSEKPPRDLNVAGLDSYKVRESTTSSLGALYILERPTLNEDLPKIKLSYASRPTTVETFNKNCLLSLQAFEAECMMENVDASFLQYLESMNMAYDYLADGVEWSKSINKNSNPKNKFGYYPTKANQDYLFSLVVQYAWKVIKITDEDTGEEREGLGVELIKDPWLLQEMIDYTPGGNFDRLVAFGAALAWANWLTKIHRVPDLGGNLTKENLYKIQQQRIKERALARSPIPFTKRN